MLNIMVTSDAAARLRAILDKEEENACVRLREFKIGSC